MTRARQSRLLSTPLAALSIATLTALGCGGGGGGPANSDGGGGSGGMKADGGGTGGSGGKGGSAGSTAGTGGGTAGTTGGSGGRGGSAGGTAGTGGGTAGTGGGTAGTGGGSAGTGGSAAGTGGGSAGTGGSAAGTGGSSAGTGGGTAGSGGGTAGSGATCTAGVGCTLANNVHGVCTNGACQACAPPDDSGCIADYGTGNICVAGNCVTGTCHGNSDCNGKICGAAHTCGSCATVSDCTTAYDASYICRTSTGKCIQGACNSNADCGGTGQICNASNACVSCGTSDGACTSAYTTGYICVSGNCVTGTCHAGSDCASTQQNCSAASHTCVDCTDDNSCQTSYGSSSYLCIVGTPNKCVHGTCRVNGDCSNGGICVNNACVNCTTDASCGTGQLCLNGGCTTGNCRVATDCSGGQVGDVCANNNCGTCGTDGDCQSATTGYGANFLCQNGTCVAGNCRTTNGPTAPTCSASGLVCSALACSPCGLDSDCTDASAYGASHICLNSVCISGNCHATTGCGTGQICDLATTHNCTGCSTDLQCADAANYGPGHYCQSSSCVPGQCRVSTDCSGGNLGKLCNASLACTACAQNSDCTGDPSYGPNHVCVAGACVSGSCATSADCMGSNQVCDTTAHACVACANDGQCMSDYGPAHICLKDGNGQNGKCVAGDCHDTSGDCTGGQVCGITTVHVCGGCTSDAICKNDNNTYGSTTICLNPGTSGTCVTGDCHDTSSDCTFGKICGVAGGAAHTCGSCAAGTTGDMQCTSDAHYTGDICFQGNCGPGNCHAFSGDCTGANSGLICGVSLTNTCGACTSDGQCRSDAFYTGMDMCNTSAGVDQGKCVSAACTVDSTTCSANSADFCCGHNCVAGNCCNDTDCVNNSGSFGVGWACVANSCTKCDGATGNKYFVDPVNGNDQTATGSNLSGGVATPSCSFKTLTRAFAIIGNFAAPNTKVILVGVAGQTRGLYTGAGGDTLPLVVPPNVIVSTTTGPITITLVTKTAGNPSGFQLNSAGSGIAGDPSGPLTLDGNNHNAGIAVVVAPGAGNSVTMSNVTIQNTLGHGINVTNGTLNIGPGVVVSNAGIVGATRDGILVSGGMANIVVPAGQTQSAFNNNTAHGIEVSGLGSVNITGVPTGAPSQNGTVIANNNTTAGLKIGQTPGAAGLLTNSISGFVAWANNNYGARLLGGSKAKVRGSVFIGNALDGILVSNSNGTVAGNDLTNIDLGQMADPGLNWLQTPLGQNPNSNAGLCVGMSAGMGVLTLNAWGNELVTTSSIEINCATTVGMITKAGTCTAHNSVGGSTSAGGTTVNVVVSNCM